MRVWEVDDVKAMPGDMVREQDFIMRLRHRHRQGVPYLVVNITFASIAALHADLELKERLQRQLAEATKQQGAELHFMSNGDGFVVAPLAGGRPRAETIERITAAVTCPETGGDAAAQLIHVYELPGGYPQIRERSNHYIEAARAASQIGSANPSPELALQSDSVRGPLTVWTLNQIEKLFEEIDIRRYVRHQPIYRHAGGEWQVAGAEYFVAVDELKRERFPRLDIRTPERLFMELCSALDHRLLNQFADRPESLAAGMINLNIAVESVLGAPFAKFTKAVPVERRRQIGFEINRGDLLLNLDTTLTAIDLLRQEKFQVTLDALHPALLTYLNVAKFDADYYKIRVSKDVIAPLSDPGVLQAMQALPREKIIFYRCDNEAALDIGRKLGVELFQGWLIDDLMAEEEKK
ncbi:MAG: EAL domain-containing protein [Alphaproteobacteria bacterium]